MFIADFHIHSKYSRATARNMDLENLDKWAKIKGIKVLGTGDFTHPEWFKKLKQELEPAEAGLFKLKKWKSETRFILTSEISCIYKKKDKVRKIHVIIFAPSFEAAEKLNNRLNLIGNIKSDGRPILGLDVKELLKIVLNASDDCLFVPAHCLPPNTYLHSKSGIKMIKDFSVGDKVYTHKGRLKTVKKIHNRPYEGKIYNIKSYNFNIGLKTTDEHPFYAIKSHKNCKNCSHTICKPSCAYHQKNQCLSPLFKKYKPEWIQAKNIEKGDILIFPRLNQITKDVKEIKIDQYLEFKKRKYSLSKNLIRLNHSRALSLPQKIKVDQKFCRLAGYYLSEGYTDSRDSIGFCFHLKEKKYVKDVTFLMRDIFNLSPPRIYKRKNADSIEIIYFSKILAKFFGTLFYSHPTVKRAHTKSLPTWMLGLPLEKQAEIFKSWWWGDAGITSSRELMNQIKIILLRLGIVPSIRNQTKGVFNKRYSHKHGIRGRIIKAQNDSFNLNRLSFFQDKFGLLRTAEFKKFNTKLQRRHGWIDKENIYLPVLKIETKKYKGKVYNLDVEEDNSYLAEFATIHNCMTPWFAIFGSKSGFDSIEECFDDYSKHIYALETGLSADPAMLWRVPDGRRVALISNSDAHSPQKTGREANAFETEMSYKDIIEAIKKKDSKKFLYTIEFYPEEGKYHFDGHRTCNVRLSPPETKKYNGICPVCGKPLTIGVLNRIEDIADKEEGFRPEGVIPFKSLVPLEEIIADVLDQGTGTKQVEKEYDTLVKKMGSEFNVLLEASKDDLAAVTLPEIAEGIIRVREGKVFKEPGYDGVYGKVRIFSKGDEKFLTKQKTLF